jgi:acyl carrier protein phosphodiesterase
MNYLAHAYLADIDDDFMLGSFIGDFVKGNLSERFSRDIKAGIAFHRKIDGFADAHERSRFSRNMFLGHRRRYAGIILDICYDHFLSKHWCQYADCALPDFIERVYQVLDAREAVLPSRLRAVMPRMRRENWLACYATLDGVQLTLERVSRRLRDKEALDGVMEDILRDYVKLEKNFFVFFQDLTAYAEACIPRRMRRPSA